MRLVILPTIVIFFLNFQLGVAQKVGDLILLKSDVKTLGVPSYVYSDAKDEEQYGKFLESNIKFRVISITNEAVELRALNFDPLTSQQKENGVRDKSEYYNDKIYKIKRSDFDAYAEKVKPVELLSIGLLTLPFKARPQDDLSFDIEFNINSTLTIRMFKFYQNTFNLQIGAGIGTVGLSTSNAAGLNAREAQDVTTLTGVAGFMIEHKKIQVGLYLGLDYINNQNHYQWISNGKTWFGFGIGYDLYNVNIGVGKNRN